MGKTVFCALLLAFVFGSKAAGEQHEAVTPIPPPHDIVVWEDGDRISFELHFPLLSAYDPDEPWPLWFEYDLRARTVTGWIPGGEVLQVIPRAMGSRELLHIVIDSEEAAYVYTGKDETADLKSFWRLIDAKAVDSPARALDLVQVFLSIEGYDGSNTVIARAAEIPSIPYYSDPMLAGDFLQALRETAERFEGVVEPPAVVRRGDRFVVTLYTWNIYTSVLTRIDATVAQSGEIELNREVLWLLRGEEVGGKMVTRGQEP